MVLPITLCSVEAGSLQATTPNSCQWHSHHTSRVRMDGAETITAGHCQVKATTASTPLCALGDESDPWSLFQKGEEGLLGRLAPC